MDWLMFLGRAMVIVAVFVAINLLAAHFMSDCGLPAVLRIAGCSDDIVRIGWPLKFYEVGGFAFHRYFSIQALLGDVLLGLLASIALALATVRFPRHS